MDSPEGLTDVTSRDVIVKDLDRWSSFHVLRRLPRVASGGATPGATCATLHILKREERHKLCKCSRGGVC